MSKRLPISRKALGGLTLDQLTELNLLVRQFIQKAKENNKRQASRKRVIVEEKVRGNKTYRLVSIRCGKKSCKCATGQAHGPYWYAFWWEDGKTRSTYVGKKRPPKV